MTTPSARTAGEALGRLSDLSIAVVGDCMLDRFVRGQVERISPEAPVPVVKVEGEDERLGGAANVAANVAALGARVQLFGVVGQDEAAQRLRRRLEDSGIDAGRMLPVSDRPTTLKTRILAGHQQVARIDREQPGPLGEAQDQNLWQLLERAGAFDAVIVSDYGKGVVGPRLMARLRRYHDDGIPVVVDPKQGNFELYTGTTAITPNKHEAAAACHARILSDHDVERVGTELRQRLSADMVLMTRGEDGMTLFRQDVPALHLPTRATEVFDVTGAGDTVIAVFSSLLAAGAAPEDAAALANLAAGVVVRELGTAVVSAAQLGAAAAADGVEGAGAAGA